MFRNSRATCLERLPSKLGVLQALHAVVVLDLIAQRAGNVGEDCEKLYAELAMIEGAIAALEAETRR
jgi:hypothetical protein